MTFINWIIILVQFNFILLKYKILLMVIIFIYKNIKFYLSEKMVIRKNFN